MAGNTVTIKVVAQDAYAILEALKLAARQPVSMEDNTGYYNEYWKRLVPFVQTVISAEVE